MPTYFEFEVSLKDIKPRIWRRFVLRKTASFMDLHEAIQDACGWTNTHLFAFREPGRTGEDIAGAPQEDDDFGFGEPAPDAAKVKLVTAFKKKDDKCLYMYDFGDGWEHEVKLRNIVEDKAAFDRRLLAGARAFPPEDCGGAWGYMDLLELAAKPEKERNGEDKERLEWCGPLDPEDFDLEGTRGYFDQ